MAVEEILRPKSWPRSCQSWNSEQSQKVGFDSREIIYRDLEGSQVSRPPGLQNRIIKLSLIYKGTNADLIVKLVLGTKDKPM